MSRRFVKPRWKTIHVAHCAGCGIPFMQTASIGRRYAVELAKRFSCARDEDADRAKVVRTYRLVER